MSGVPVQLKSSDFTLQTLTNPLYKNKTVLVFYSAKWCRYCQEFNGSFEKLAKEMPNIVFAKVDIDEERSFVGYNNNLVHPLYYVKSFPTVVVYKNGDFIHKIEDRSEDTLKKILSYIDSL